MKIDYIILAVVALLAVGSGLLLLYLAKGYRKMKSKRTKNRCPNPVSKLMRRGAASYSLEKEDEALGVLADAAMAAADRATDSIDETLSYVDASNKRIAAMEAKAIKDRKAWDLMMPVEKGS